MSPAGRERDPGEGASPEAMADVVGYLRAELQSIREREQRWEARTAAFGPDAAPGAAPLDPPVEVRLDRLLSALVDGLTAIPDGGGQLAEREELARLAEQLDGLRTSMIDRFDAIQLPDLRPVVEHLERMHQQIGALPVPDLHPVRERIDQLHHEIQALTPPDLEPVRARLDQLHQQIAGLPRADQVVGALAPQLDAVRDALRPDGVLEAIDAMAATLRAQVTGIGALGPQVRQAVEPLGARLDRLVESDSAARKDLMLAREVLVGLTQLAEASEQHLNELLNGQESALLAERNLLASSFADLSRALAEQAQGVDNQLGALFTRIAAIEDNVSAHLHTAVAQIEQGLGAQLHDQRSELGLTELNASVAAIVQQLDDDRAEDLAVRDAIQAVDTRLTELGLGQLPATVAGLSQQVSAGRSEDRLLVEAVRDLEARLDNLDPAPFGATVADLVQQLASGRNDSRMVADAVRSLNARVGDLDTAGLAPVRSGIDALRSQLDAFPAPDLSTVEAALARITAAILSESRQQRVTAEDLSQLAQSMNEAIGEVVRLVERQGAQMSAVASHVATLLPPGGGPEANPTDPSLQDTLERVIAELAATRHAVERRGGSRRRRRSEEDHDPPLEVMPPVKLLPDGPTAGELRLAAALARMDQRLAELTRQIQRTADHAPTAPTLSAAGAPARRADPWGSTTAPAKKTPAKKTPAKKTPAKKTPAKGASAAPRARGASSVRTPPPPPPQPG